MFQSDKYKGLTECNWNFKKNFFSKIQKQFAKKVFQNF